MAIANKKKRFLVSFINVLIDLVWFPVRLFSRKYDLATFRPETILLVRLDYVGDLVMTTPAFSLVRERFPAARILLLAGGAGKAMFAGDRRIDEVIPFNWPWPHLKSNNQFTLKQLGQLFRIVRMLRQERIDLFVDFRGDVRFLVLFGLLTGAKARMSNSRCGKTRLLDYNSEYDLSRHEVERSVDVLRGLGVQSQEIRPSLPLTKKEIFGIRQLVEAEIKEASGGNIVVVAPFSSKDVKSWPKEHFLEVIAHLIAKGMKVIIVGTKEEMEDASALAGHFPEHVVSLAGKTSLRQLAALTAVASMVVGVDTGVLHIAACYDTPIVAVFGPTRAVEFRPYSPFSVVVDRHQCQCNQFLHAKCDVPVNGYAKCMAEVSPAMLIKAIDQVLLTVDAEG